MAAWFVRPLPVSACQLHDNQTPDGAPAAFSADYSRFDTDFLNELKNYVQDYDCSAAIVFVRKWLRTEEKGADVVVFSSPCYDSTVAEKYV